MLESFLAMLAGTALTLRYYLIGIYVHPGKGGGPPTGMADGTRARSTLHGVLMPFEPLLARFGMRRSKGARVT